MRSLLTVLIVSLSPALTHAVKLPAVIKRVACALNLVSSDEVPFARMAEILPHVDPEFLKRFKWVEADQPAEQLLRWEGTYRDPRVARHLRVAFDRFNFTIQPPGVPVAYMSVILNVPDQETHTKSYEAIVERYHRVHEASAMKGEFSVTARSGRSKLWRRFLGKHELELDMDIAGSPTDSRYGIELVNRSVRSILNGEDLRTQFARISDHRTEAD